MPNGFNDTKADNEVLTINGHRGWHISGTARPYFKKEQAGRAYEGYFICMRLFDHLLDKEGYDSGEILDSRAASHFAGVQFAISLCCILGRASKSSRRYSAGLRPSLRQVSMRL